jgi:hypothetical protein
LGRYVMSRQRVFEKIMEHFEKLIALFEKIM